MGRTSAPASTSRARCRSAARRGSGLAPSSTTECGSAPARSWGRARSSWTTFRNASWSMVHRRGSCERSGVVRSRKSARQEASGAAREATNVTRGSDDERTADSVRVSVLMLTYNQEPYVRQAIDSVLTQRTTFGYELVVSDDCSSDGTAKTVKELEGRHPETIHAWIRDRNLGMLANFAATLAVCRGEYVALLD